VVKTYRTPTSEVRALQGVTFEFPRGALTAVAGPSGSGKSSLLRLLAGVDRPTMGTVEVEGTPVHSASGRSLRRLRRRVVGYVFQRPSDNFLPYLTVADHLRMAAGPRSARPEFDVGDLVERLGIAHRLDHLASELSGGEQQRAAIAEVLVAGAAVVVADEPTAELDSASASALVGTLRDLVDGGIAVVTATHDAQLRRAADVALHLDHGRQKARPAPARRDPFGGGGVAGPGDAHAPWRRGGAAPTDIEPSAEPHARQPVGVATAAVFDARGLRKSFRRGPEVVHAVDGVTLSVEQGEVVGLVGRSGSGKSTLLNLVAGWEEPDEGSVRWFGGEGDGTPRWRDVAVLPQRLGLLDELTVRGNVEWPARLDGDPARVRGRVDELLEALGLAQLEERLPREISVGEQQRTALARALVLSPRVVLADEPTGHQDDRTATAVFEVLRRAARDGTACLIATHNAEVAPYLDRVLRMADGRIAGDGSA
jgi:putative ABC transport system ATP-binding protein